MFATPPRTAVELTGTRLYRLYSDEHELGMGPALCIPTPEVTCAVLPDKTKNLKWRFALELAESA